MKLELINVLRREDRKMTELMRMESIRSAHYFAELNVKSTAIPVSESTC